MSLIDTCAIHALSDERKLSVMEKRVLRRAAKKASKKTGQRPVFVFTKEMREARKIMRLEKNSVRDKLMEEFRVEQIERGEMSNCTCGYALCTVCYLGRRQYAETKRMMSHK